jgi:hypothetical protein
MFNCLTLLEVYINAPFPRGHGGIRLGKDDVRPLQIVALDDGGKPDIAAAAVRALVRGEGAVRPKVHFLLGPFSSYLTEAAAKAADELRTLLIAPGAALTSVFTNRTLTFGLMEAAKTALHGVIEGIYKMTEEHTNERAVASIAFIAEDAPVMLEYCAGAASKARSLDPNLATQVFKLSSAVRQNWDSDASTDSIRALLHNVSRSGNISASRPFGWDAVVGCTYDDPCHAVLKVMATDEVYVKALSFLNCPPTGQDGSGLLQETEYMEYLIGDSHNKTEHTIASSDSTTGDAVSGGNMTPTWTHFDIQADYREHFFTDASESAWSMMYSGLLLVHAIETCAQNASRTYNTSECMNSERIAGILRSGRFHTPVCERAFDESQQAKVFNGLFDSNQQAIVPRFLYQLRAAPENVTPNNARGYVTLLRKILLQPGEYPSTEKSKY